MILHVWSRLRQWILLGIATITISPVLLGGTSAWDPVTDAEKNLKAPVIDKDAGAEALFWRVHVTNEYYGTTFEHYVRIKIFNQRGCETQHSTSVEGLGTNSISDISGRTIKADGTILELEKSAISISTIIKTGSLKYQRASFAMPGVEPGAIIEYRWRETLGGFRTHFRLQFQRDIPVQEVKYFIKAMDIGFGAGISLAAFLTQPTVQPKGKDGWYEITVTNVPAYLEEPMMPPDAQVKPWVLVFRTEKAKVDPQKYWIDEGKRLFEAAKPYIKVNNDVRRATEEATLGAKDPEEKLDGLVRYCRSKIKNLADDDVTERQREKAKENHSPSDTLKRASGTSFDINVLFAAMASAAGFDDTRVALLANRDDLIFDTRLTDIYFLPYFAVAVKRDSNWRFYNPASDDLPSGMLPWQQEGADALIVDAKNPSFTKTSVSEPEKSNEKREGTFELREDGTLAGEVRILYTGHCAAGRRAERRAESAAQREEAVRAAVTQRFSNAKVSEIKLENVEDPEKPLIYAFRVTVPGYAQKTGKRLFLPTEFFEHGAAPLFPASNRKYPVFFHYGWAEEDNIQFILPHGYELEHAETPSSLNFGRVGNYTIALRTGDGKLFCERKLVFGRESMLIFGSETYTQLKGAFDKIAERDEHTITLHQQSNKGKQ